MKLQGALPKGTADGLSAIAPAMVGNPTGMHIVIAVLDTAKVTRDTDTGAEEPTARVRRIEVISPGDAGQAEKLMRRAMEHRIGATVLPLDLEDEIAFMFGKLDPTTGELLESSAKDDPEGD